MTEENPEVHQLPEPGVFRIELESKNSSADTHEKSGATLASWSAEDQIATQGRPPAHDQDFPMIVWLRGDEPWFAQFDLDAQTVMDQLGIKRSRLTQISGKELRVGRVRVDRYIRPVFRSQDVANYLNWTRATASHQKSSSALKEAAETLQTQGQQIAQVVADATQNFSESLKSGLLSELEAAASRSVAQLSDEVIALKEHVTDRLAKVSLDFERSTQITTTQLHSQDFRLDALENTLTAIALRFAEISGKQSQLHEEQSGIQKILMNLTEQSVRQNELLQRLEDQLKPKSRIVRVRSKPRPKAMLQSLSGVPQTFASIKPARKHRVKIRR